MTSEIAVALNEPVEAIVTHNPEIANVGMLPTTGGEVALATTGSLERLGRNELPALVAAQFAGRRDRWCRLATRAEYLWHALPYSMLLVPFALILGRVPSTSSAPS